MTDKTVLHVRHFGDGARPLLALHCMLAHAEVWRPVAEYLQTAALTAPDLLSHGNSSDWDGKSDFHDANTAAISSLLQEQRCDVVGHSFGATLALRLAVEHPHLVRSLTLIEPVYFAALKTAAPDVLSAHLTEARPYSDAIDAGDYATGVQRFMALWGSGVPWESMAVAAQQYLIDRTHLVPAQYPAIFEDRQAILSPERLAQITAPVLLVRGDKSPSVTSHINDALAHRLPDARQATIAGAGHMLPITHPEQTARAIEGLLEVT